MGATDQVITPLLPELEKANYDGKPTDELWEDIKEAMHFDFEWIDGPGGQLRNTEGFRWVKFTKFLSGWGHEEWVKQLIGMEVVLIYPNCD